MHSFSLSSIFVSSLSRNCDGLDSIIDKDNKITIILFNQTSTNHKFSCPSISELKSVLNEKLIVAFQELFRFWLANIHKIIEAVSSLADFSLLLNGVVFGKFVNFLYVHHSVMLNIIFDHCQRENFTSSLCNLFIEQLANLTSEYINDAVNIFVNLAMDLKVDLTKLNIKYSHLGRLITVLCVNGQRYRKLVLASRWSLKDFKPSPLMGNSHALMPVTHDNVDACKWEAMDKHAAITQGLLGRNISALKSFFHKHKSESLANTDLTQETRSIILGKLDKLSWNDVTELIRTLGYEPVKTLTSLCLETTDRRIRDIVYSNLRLERISNNFCIAKNIVDGLENIFNIPLDNEGDQHTEKCNLYSFIQPFIDRLDKTKYQNLKANLKNSVSSTSQKIHLKLIWFVDFLHLVESDLERRELLKMVDLCSMDADYRNIVTLYIHKGNLFIKKVHEWLHKWIDKGDLLIEYVMTTNNIRLAIALIESDMEACHPVIHGIVDQLISLLISESNILDQCFASTVINHLFIHNPALFIQRLTECCANDLALASDLISKIHPGLGLHIQCSDHKCPLKTVAVSDLPLMSFINGRTIDATISNMVEDEFPIFLYFLLTNGNGNSVNNIRSASGYTIESTVRFISGMKANSKVDLFQCFLSANLSELDSRVYTMEELDEIMYAILLAGISYDGMVNSSDETMTRINEIFKNNDYWNKLRRRLLRPSIMDDDATNTDQYYEANLYNFLHRSGFPLDLTNVFAWQSQNGFASDVGTKPFPTLTNLVTKHQSLFEISKYSLDYIYYLSLGRPYQAFAAIINKFTDTRKPDFITQDLLKEIVKGILQVALSNISDQQIVGACFGLLRLIGSGTECLRCYLTLANWVIDWHVVISERNYMTASDGSQLSTDELRKIFELKIGKLFKMCFSKVMLDRKRSRERLLRQLEDMFLFRLNNNYYSQLSEIVDGWSFVLYFCQQHGLEFSTILLQFYAQRNEWLLFLCCAQFFGYLKEQVKLAINKFEDVCIRQHMSYIVSKVDAFFSIGSSVIKNSKLGNSSGRSSNVTESYFMDNDIKIISSKSKESSTSKSKPNKFSRTVLQNGAKDNLIELIFDCRISSPTKDHSSNGVQPMILNSKKLLAYSLVLNNPFLSVLAYCSDCSKDDLKPEENFVNYLNCLCCFILASFSKRIIKDFWNKWLNMVKIDWTEEETIELIVFAIRNRLTNIVADAFFVLQCDKYIAISPFYSMMANSVDIWNPVQRQHFLMEFIKKCSNIVKTSIFQRDRLRSKSNKEPDLLFFNKLLESSLLAGMSTVQKNFGSRFLAEWFESLCVSIFDVNKIHVKQILPVDDINICLLNDVFNVFFDFIDLDKIGDIGASFEENSIPVNIRSKEFVDFIDQLIMKIIDVASHSIDYTKSRLIASVGKLMNRISEIPSFVLLHEKRNVWKSKLETLQQDQSNLISNQSITDLVSFAFSGQIDKDDIVQLCIDNRSDSSVSDNNPPSTNPPVKVYHGTTDCWRRLVIPEDWQEQIFNISDAVQNSQSEVSHVNSLLNEKKWIEACSYMIENEVYVKDAIFILLSMNVACGKTDPNRLSSFIIDSSNDKKVHKVKKDGKFKAAVRRLSVFTYSTSKLTVIPVSEHESTSTRIHRQNRNAELCQKCLRNVLKVMIHGQAILEYVYTIYCVASKMSEPYLTVAREEEFHVLTNILVGTYREKIDTADMYLGVVDIDQDQLSRFIAEITVQVLKSELQSNLVSSSVSISNNATPRSQKDSPMRSSVDIDNPRDTRFTISPASSNSSHRSSISQTRRHSILSFRKHVDKIVQYCQLRPELHTIPFIKHSTESRLMKTFYLDDLLILTPNHRKLGRILYDYYVHFNQEIFSSQEDAEFLVFLLVQCHTCFTDGGDTVGISLVLKSAKDLWKMLTNNGYFVLLAQLLCRIGRYGKMPYIFTTLIEHEHFELLLRKDMDKEGTIVPYIFEYLNRYLSDDFEKVELVCHKYNCYYELAETETKKTIALIKKIKPQFWKNFTKESLKITISTIVSNLLQSCKNYFKVGCYKKINENLRKAQFFKLQQKWIEDSDKLYNVGSFSSPINKVIKVSSNKLDFPETNAFGGLKLIDMNIEQALGFMKKVPNFYNAFIIMEYLKLSADCWIDLIVHHVLINGDDTFMGQYIEYFGKIVSANFVQQCTNRYEKLMKNNSSKSYTNMKLLLKYCNDVFLLEDYQKKYHLTK